MQTLVDLDSDVEALLREQARERNLDFDQVLNEAVRAGLSANAIADEETVRMMQGETEREERRKTLMSLEGSLSKEEGEELRTAARKLRKE